MYLNTNARALPAPEASKLFEEIARNLKEACHITVRATSYPLTFCVVRPSAACDLLFSFSNMHSDVSDEVAN